jgi:hypothetical protein
VKVTDAPTQIVEPVDVIATNAGPPGDTVIVIVLEIGEGGVAQVALEVMITVTMSPLAKVLVVYVGEFVPTLPPFTCH